MNSDNHDGSPKTLEREGRLSLRRETVRVYRVRTGLRTGAGGDCTAQASGVCNAVGPSCNHSKPNTNTTRGSGTGGGAGDGGNII
jgi:hypothetical protein